MHQKRMCEYLDLPCRHTRTFLHLPTSVRRKVYINAGLTVGEDIVLRCRPPKEPWRYLEKPNDEDKAYRLVRSLLQTCRAIHDEISGILCSENRIVLCHRHIEYGLEYLRRLSPQICTELRALYVHLYLVAPLDPRYPHGPSFKGSEGLKKTVVTAWQKAASHVLTHAKRRRLSLYLICDTGEDEKTASVLQPLEDHQSALKGCHLRLHPTRNCRISSLARSVALRATGQHRVDEQQPFRFMDLPPELRDRILQFSDLVTPWNEVDVTFGSLYRQSYGSPEDDDFAPWNPHPWQFINCSPGHADVTGCYCQARLSGYSPACRCWVPPSSLMLVSRAMYQEAIAVLYKRNRVIVLPDPNLPSAKVGREHLLPTRLAASTFSTIHTNHSVLSRLRELEVVFPSVSVPHNLRFPQQDGSANSNPLSPYLDWRFAVDHLKEQHANLGSMTFIVHMRSGLERQLMTSAESSDDKELLQPHRMLLEPLQKLREGGLRRLFVFLQWDYHYLAPPPLRGRATHVTLVDNQRSRERRRIDEIEVMLEREIMGQDYDNSRVGKLN